MLSFPSVDLGTADELSLDCLINMLTSFSLEYVGIKKLFLGGENQDWPRPKEVKSDMEVSDSSRGLIQAGLLQN